MAESGPHGGEDEDEDNGAEEREDNGKGEGEDEDRGEGGHNDAEDRSGDCDRYADEDDAPVRFS